MKDKDMNKQNQSGKGPTAGNLNKDKGQQHIKPGEGRPNATGGKQDYNKPQGGFGGQTNKKDDRGTSQR
jgi:hypothetical protein